MKDNVTDHYMLKFIEEKMRGVSSGETKVEDLPYFQYIHQHLKEVWYGLMIGELIQPPSKKVDKFIEKFAKQACYDYWDSVGWSLENPYDTHKDKYCVTKIGTLTLY